MAFTIANMKKKKQIFSRNQKIPSAGMFSGQMLIGDSQPPNNRIEHIAHISTMDRYSPRKNSRHGEEEYSTKKPAPSSECAATRSKGGRLVSASAETKKIGNMGKRMEKTFQCASVKMPDAACARTMS